SAKAQNQIGTVNEEIRQLARRAPLAMEFTGTTAADASRWQAAFAAKLRELLAPFQPPTRWETSLEQTAEFDDHRRESLTLRADGISPLPLYLLSPKPQGARKYPGIVALHGHGKSGNDPVVGIAKTPEARAELEQARYDYGLNLVRQGYVVVAPCFSPFGRRL